MALTLTNDPNVLDANPVKYSRALQIAAGGHVLWHPSHIVRDGGIIGDCGYFDGGRFQVLFNVFDPPNELDIPALPHPTGRELRVEELPNYNTILQSSQSHTVRVEASLESPPLPNLPVLKVELAAHAAVSDQTIAFLAFCGPRRRTDWYAKTNALEKYLVQYEDKILQHFGDYPIRSGNVVIVNGSTRAVSWWGGISHSHSTSVSGRAGIVDGTGVSVEVDNTHNWPWIFSRGPEIWEEDCDPNRSLILRVVSIKRRLPILRATRKVFTTISDFAGAGLRREASRNTSTTPLGDGAAGVSSDLGARDNQADSGRDLLADHSERLGEILGLADLGEWNSQAANRLDEQDEDGDLGNSLVAEQPDLLSDILDLVLETYPDIDVAVGSWETIAESVQLLSAASGDDIVEPIITRFREGTDVVAQLLNLQLRASTPRTNPTNTASDGSAVYHDVVWRVSSPNTMNDRIAGTPQILHQLQYPGTASVPETFARVASPGTDGTAQSTLPLGLAAPHFAENARVVGIVASWAAAARGHVIHQLARGLSYIHGLPGRLESVATLAYSGGGVDLGRAFAWNVVCRIAPKLWRTLRDILSILAGATYSLHEPRSDILRTNTPTIQRLKSIRDIALLWLEYARPSDNTLISDWDQHAMQIFEDVIILEVLVYLVPSSRRLRLHGSTVERPEKFRSSFKATSEIVAIWLDNKVYAQFTALQYWVSSDAEGYERWPTILALDKKVLESSGLLHINTLQAASSAFYQQCSQLMERLTYVHGFQAYFAFASRVRSRQSPDLVTHLRDCLALGVPLCFLFNLLPGPRRIDIRVEPEDINPHDRKAHQRATAAFVSNMVQLQKNDGDWEEGIGFKIRDLINDDGSATGFAKVVRTVTALVDRLPQHVFMHDIPPFAPLDLASPEGAGHFRAESIDALPPTASEADRKAITNEILVTERKYVGELETVQQFANELATRSIIDHDIISRMFGNLPAVFDFQQRFLITMEQVAEQPWPEQMWGRLFSDNEEGFQVYEPYCADYRAAADLVLKEGSKLLVDNLTVATQCALSIPTTRARALIPIFLTWLLLSTSYLHVDANFNPNDHQQDFTAVISLNELPAFLVKPVLRVSKYQLFLESLIKMSQGSVHPDLDELRAGLASVKRIVSRINEAERRIENKQMVKAFESRVKDWRGHHLNHFGDLLLDDIFTVTRSEVDRDYHVFLFEWIILLCLESTPQKGPRKGSNGPRVLKQQDNIPLTSSVGVNTAAARMRTTPLLLKGRIFTNNVIEASSLLVNDMWLLHVRWKSEDGQEQFTLHCNNKEQLDLWETAINRRTQEIHARRASEKAEKAATMRVGRQPDHTNPAVPPHDEKNYFTAPSSQSSTLSDSSLPPYPGPPVAEFPWIGIKNAPPRSARVDFYPVSQKYGSAPFEDDAADSLDAISGYAQSNSRRGTPGRRGIATKSMAPERDLAPGYEPNRARTADPNGRLFRQWTHGSPTVFAPTGELPTPPTWGVGQQRSQFDSTRLRNEYDSYGQPLPRYLEVKPSDQLPPRLPDGSLTVSRRANADAGDGSNKRGSGSSQRTDADGSDSGSHSMRQERSSTAPDSQGTPPAAPLSLPIRVKVYYGEDLFVIGVPRTTKFDDLMDSIGKKIRLCDPHREDRPLRVKYSDDEGDMVSLASNEDMQIAFESSQVAFHVQ